MATPGSPQVPPHPVFAHDGPWTEDAFLALRASGTVPAAGLELVDGSLLLSPGGGDGHRRVAERLRAGLAAAMPPGLAQLGAVPLRVAPGRILVPDLVVVTGPEAGGGVHDAADVLMVIEVVSGGNALVDRAVKPQLYAEAAIPYYVRVEQDGPVAVAYLLIGGRYLEHVRAAEGQPLQLAEPFPVALDLAEPAAAAPAE